ncbi:retrovirus-related pol polyprotein from transposon TNT 1-94 [Tanacetum coccineum]|uniref:Retrovirus-related pol polyprotein from transposon TNT 1-94 n=1 Tax=Tanacetum coccineum TaxID=301880 RepID=A0ABQ4Z274_9ASTR
MQEELHQFDRLKVWELVDKPFGKIVINLKWLWKNKKDEDNTAIRNKARLVAKGYQQEEGIDFGNLLHQSLTWKQKALYGLKQAPRAWYDELSTFLISKGFTKGLQIHQSPQGIFINHAKYALEILKKHGMDKCDSIGTPMATKAKLDADLSGTPVDQTRYQSYQVRPTKKHLKEVKRIFRYLKGTINMGIWYPKDSGDKLASWMSKKQNCTSMSTAKAKTKYQLADMFTKALSQERFEYLVGRLGMRCLTPAELEKETDANVIGESSSRHEDSQSSQPKTTTQTTQTKFADDFYSADDPFNGADDFDPFFGLDSELVGATTECVGKGKWVALDDDQVYVADDNEVEIDVEVDMDHFDKSNANTIGNKRTPEFNANEDFDIVIDVIDNEEFESAFYDGIERTRKRKLKYLKTQRDLVHKHSIEIRRELYLKKNDKVRVMADHRGTILVFHNICDDGLSGVVRPSQVYGSTQGGESSKGVKWTKGKIVNSEGYESPLRFDGAFMKGPFPSHLLTVVGVDPNNGIYPLAYGIAEAIIELFPVAEHRYCLRHIHKNMKLRWSGTAYKELLWKVACKLTIPECDKAMDKLNTFNKDYYD